MESMEVSVNKLAPVAILLALAALTACQSARSRQEGPIDTFSFLSTANPRLPQNVNGAITERADPKSIHLVVPAGTDLSRVVATLALNTEATITVISSGERVVQENGRTPQRFLDAGLVRYRAARRR
jgi:hypothetical protein